MRNRNAEIRRRAEKILRKGDDLAFGQALAEARQEIDREAATGGDLREAREPVTSKVLEEARERLFSEPTARPEISEDTIEEAASRLFDQGGAW